MGRSWSTTFSIFDLWIRSGDIRDESGKLSEIVKKIGRFFWLSQILGGRPSKHCTQVITPGSRHVVRIKICDGIPIRSELIDVYTLNFKPNFKFSRLKFLGETPVPFGVCARWPWSISSACKNFRAQPPLKAKIQSAKKCALRWVNTQVNNFFVCGPKFKNFFSPTWEGL